MLIMHFSCYKEYIKWDAQPFWVAFEYCGQNYKKREGYIQFAKYATKNAKMTFDPKMPTMFFNPKSENIGQMCIFTL